MTQAVRELSLPEQDDAFIARVESLVRAPSRRKPVASAIPRPAYPLDAPFGRAVVSLDDLRLWYACRDRASRSGAGEQAS